MAADAWHGLRDKRHMVWVRLSGALAVALSVVVLAVTAPGCAKRGPTPGIPTGGGGEGVGEGQLPSGSSLERARRGLAPEEDGILADVHFPFDSYDLSQEARAILKKNTDWLKANRRVTVELEGHTDERGTIEYNLALGARRAKAVKDYLVVLGVDEERMATISYGEELPVCREVTEDCWLRNRRVHFVILSP